MKLKAESTFDLLRRLWVNINKHYRWQFLLVFIFMVLTAFFEIVSIGAIIPFLSILTNPSSFNQGLASTLLTKYTGLAMDSESLLLAITTVFILAALITGVMRIALLWMNSRLSYAAGADLSHKIYLRTLYQPYSVHLARNSSQVISGISSKADGVIASITTPCLILLSSIIIGGFILVSLFYIDPVVAITTFSMFGFIYVVIFIAVRKKISINSACIARESTQVIKSLQEGLGGIRDVLIDGSQALYCQIYANADKPLRRAQGNILFITQSPRYGIEALGIVLISFLAYFLTKRQDGALGAIPILGALALGSQKLLPIMQQTYSSWTSIQGARSSLLEVLSLLEQPIEKGSLENASKPLQFLNEISLENISFQYENTSKAVLNNVTLSIKKGSCVGFIGKTGSGKSTLLDVVMGLLMPSNGYLKIDGQAISIENKRAWQANIAHVPQSIYLVDGTIADNIAFGVPSEKIDFSLVKKAAEKAQIAESICSWPDGYQTIAGERGVRLSGGQRQRIGIARALYKQAKIIIFDEATSALDNETEESVMEAIGGLGNNVTLLIVAHRLSTLKKCSQIVELDYGSVVRVGSFKEVIQKN
jgi:ATP-binding cassette subfamily B protein